jgi:hypothetical protein
VIGHRASAPGRSIRVVGFGDANSVQRPARDRLVPGSTHVRTLCVPSTARQPARTTSGGAHRRTAVPKVRHRRRPWFGRPDEMCRRSERPRYLPAVGPTPVYQSCAGTARRSIGAA